MRPPDRHQVDHAPAARVDHVLIEELLPEVDRLLAEPEERDRLGYAVALPERTAEARDLVLRIAARRREQADLRPGRFRQLDDQVADRVVPDPAVEVVAAQGQDATPHGHLRATPRARA